MTRTQKNIIPILSLITVLLISAIGITVFQKYQTFASQPLGPVLPFTPISLPPTWTPDPNAIVQNGNVTLVPTISFPTSTPQTICGAQTIMNIVVVGADARADTYDYGLGDVIRIVRVDFFTPKVTVLEFPLYLWVEIPHISDNFDRHDHVKLNQA